METLTRVTDHLWDSPSYTALGLSKIIFKETELKDNFTMKNSNLIFHIVCYRLLEVALFLLLCPESSQDPEAACCSPSCIFLVSIMFFSGGIAGKLK